MTISDDVVKTITRNRLRGRWAAEKMGLKGKEANELEADAGRVRTALNAGDRAAALRRARDLARRVDDLPRNLDDAAAARLESTSAALVTALER